MSFRMSNFRFDFLHRTTDDSGQIQSHVQNLWSSQEQQAQSSPHEISTDSWCPLSSPSSSLPREPGGSPSSVNMTKPTDRLNSLSNVSPAEAAGIIAILKGKSVDELRKLVSNKNSYQNLLLSPEPVKTHNRLVRNELRNEKLQLTKSFIPLNLLLPQEKLHELERKKEDAFKYYSPSSLVHQLQGSLINHCFGATLIFML